MKLKRILTALIISLFACGTLYAQDIDAAADKVDDKKDRTQDEKGEKKDVSFSIHGYAQANFAVGRNDDRRDRNKWNTSKYEMQRIGATLQLELEGNAYDVAHFYSALRVEYNAVGEKTCFQKYYNFFAVPYEVREYLTYFPQYDRSKLDNMPTFMVRETYVDLYSKHVTFRAGHQIISWGEIEGIETPSDVIIPWDYTTMSSVFEDSRLAVTAADLSFFFAKQKLELIWIPLFQPAKIPMDIVYKKGAQTLTRPRFEIRNSEYAARLSGNLGTAVRYGLGFLYGFDDMPDTSIKMWGAYQSFPGSPMPIFLPSIVRTELVYNRAMTPTFDLGIAAGEVLTWKISANAMIRSDHKGHDDTKKNSSVTYLTGPESTNIFGKIYLSLYVGQVWTINYTKPVEYSNLIGTMMKMNAWKTPSKDIIEGYDQQYPYKYIISSVIQRSFLTGSALDVQIRWWLCTDPKFYKWDYVVNPNIMYKFTNGVSATLGIQWAHRMGVDRHLGTLEVRYTF